MNIATLVQSQTLATLLQAMSPGEALAPGQTVEAKLLSLDGDGKATAQIGDVRIALVLAGPAAKQAALQPGASLFLKFEAPAEPGQPLRATLLEARPPQQQAEPETSRLPTQPQVADAASRLPARQQGQPTPTQGETAQRTASGTAGAASPFQPGIATPSRSPIAAPGIPVDHVVLQAEQPAPASAAAAEPASPRAAAGPMIGQAMAQQDSLAPLMANLRGLAEGSLALILPKPLLQRADQVLALALPVERQAPTGAMLKAAVQRSGLFLEANQAQGQSVAPQADLKAGLIALRDALGPIIARLTEEPARPATALPNAGAGRSAPAAEAIAPDAPDLRPAPPRRDGAPTFQPIAEPTLQPGDKPLLVAETLLRQTESALDRVTLSQYASLPPDQPRADMQGPRWLTELPLALQAGIAMMPLHVEKEPPRPGQQEAQGPLWRVRFALDIEPMGPLQGVVTLQGRNVGVTLWAVREETSRLLRQAAPGLEAALVDARFENGAVEVHLGQPRIVQPTAGQFLDRMS